MIKLIHGSLTSGQPQVVNGTIQYTKAVFTLDYRGLLVLVPPYLAQVGKVLAESAESPNVVKSSAVSILASLLALPTHYAGYEIPLLDSPGQTLPMAKAAESIHQILKKLLESDVSKLCFDKYGYKVVKKALCCATTIIYQEAANEKEMAVSTVKVFVYL